MSTTVRDPARAAARRLPAQGRPAGARGRGLEPQLNLLGSKRAKT